ncbi:hypothetical protein B0H11DRAFT_380315 [Mycena galericulata]|nr:hypothetical protein B0H11DRAFT_380315 [Mycena galericulata]
MSGQIFNVEESSHPSEFQTTAAQAQANAPTAPIAREVEANAEQVKEVAENAAFAAQAQGPALTGQSATDRLQTDASIKTGAAVDQGRSDVEAAKATGAGYVEQAKNLVASAATGAVTTAQSYLPPGSGPNGEHTTGDVVTGLQNAGSAALSTGSAALATTKEYLVAAQTTAQPHLERARDIAQPHLEHARDVAASYMPGTTTTQTAPVAGEDVKV